ncbi:spore germination protein [Xylanibacillus composti]|uniref:Spore germination protein n=2 Tax=Xylanibacillus composti TaxID=1572762 RepID=A0A8J4M262_9BACL|nr:spore germination protein [Xylanibacillus composti]
MVQVYLFRMIKKLLLRKEQQHELQQGDSAPSPPTLAHVLQEFEQCSDLKHRFFPDIHIDVLYFDHMVSGEDVGREILQPLRSLSVQEVSAYMRRSPFKRIDEAKRLIKGILDGQTALFWKDQAYLADTNGPQFRSVQQSETETVITGPHDSFIENIQTNLSLIRSRIKSSHLKVIPCEVGEITKTTVYILFIQDIANRELVHKLVRRIESVEMDGLTDTNMLIQYIDEHPNSVFPQFLTTERPDAAVSRLLSGRIVGIVDGSPSAFSAPTNFFEFFSSPDDYYQRWMLGTALRFLRFLAFIITVTFTAFYVSVTTYHYEMIPAALLTNLAESRYRVPFPPIYEALLMEITIELLREAGARLPTKIGQTIGIVGGIVIGQAAVQAGLTSNVLIIAVASSAIASFVIPSYVMSASIRLIRFGLIVLAGMWGNMGLMFGVAYIVIHLSGLSNLGVSYLSPLAPMNVSDWKDVFIRAPYWLMRKRSTSVKSPNPTRNRMKQ